MKKYYITTTSYNIKKRVLKDKSIVYDVVFRYYDINGKQKQKYLCGYSKMQDAKIAYLTYVNNYCEIITQPELKKLINAKNQTQESIDSTINHNKIKDIMPYYYKSITTINKESTIFDKHSAFDNYFIPFFGEYKLNDIDSNLIYKWQDNLWQTRSVKTNEIMSRKQLTKIRGFAFTFFRWIEDRYNITTGVNKVKMPRNISPTIKTYTIWTIDDFNRFIKVVDKPIYKAFFTMAFFTGRRKNELLALSPSDIKGNMITYNKSITYKTLNDDTYKITSTKTNKVQTLPTPTQVLNALNEYHYNDTDKFIFGGNKPIAPNTLKRAFIKYCQLSNTPIIRIHDLRHSYVSMLIHNGTNILLVANMIGDTVEQVQQTYGHYYKEDELNIINKLSQMQ